MNLDVIVKLIDAATAVQTLYKKNVDIEHVPNLDYRPVIFAGAEQIYGTNENAFNTLNNNSITWIVSFTLNESQDTIIGNYLNTNGWTVVTNWYDTI